VTNSVGVYKKMACDNCTGDILVELDHDDFLTPLAIADIRKAFKENPDVGFVYSNSMQADMEWNRPQRFDERHGWKWRETKFRGHLLDEAIAFDPTPAAVSRIWYAPDHVRAFKRELYNKVGGHNPQLTVLDDQDLMCRLYLETKFYHIDKALYVYRIHQDNSWLVNNQKIQEGVYPLYHQYIDRLALKWATDSNLEKIDLGGRLACPEGYKSVDLKDADIIANLENRWPFAANSVGVVRAYDVFEHLRNPVHTMKELYRVLAPGGYAFIQVPSTDGRGAFQDPTHVSFWNENSFLYYINQNWAQYINTPVRFQSMSLYTTGKNDQQVCWAVAHLVKLKEGYTNPPGLIDI
jgi:O-antigen biosynthesis protein